MEGKESGNHFSQTVHPFQCYILPSFDLEKMIGDFTGTISVAPVVEYGGICHAGSQAGEGVLFDMHLMLGAYIAAVVKSAFICAWQECYSLYFVSKFHLKVRGREIKVRSNLKAGLLQCILYGAAP